MSLFLSRLSLRADFGTLAYGPTLLVLVACHHGSSAPASSHAERRPVPRETGGRLVRGYPGVDVVSTRNGGFVIRIISGLTGGGEPLYDIDGHTMFVDPNRGIDWFKPDDIVRIKVLKTPDETAVYGPRGVHGVILISTKQGSRSRRPGGQAARAAEASTLVRALRG